jgi:hypothetical protein
MDIYLFFKNTWLIPVFVKEILKIKQSKSQKPLPSKSPKGEEGREGGGLDPAVFTPCNPSLQTVHKSL